MIRILLNGKDAQFNNEDIDGLRVTIRANDVSDFGKTQGDYAINLKLPFTDINRELINNSLDIQNKTGYLQTANIICDVIVNSYTVIKGKLYIEKWDSKFFYGYIISNNINWSNELANKSIRDIESFRKFRYSGPAIWDLQLAGTETLPDGTPYTFGNTVQLFDVWNDDGTLYDVQFPLVAYGNFPVPPGSASGNFYANANGFFFYNHNVPPTNIVNNRTPGNTNFATMSWQQFYPAVYLRSLVKAIFADVNLTIKGSFLTDARFDNLLIPYTPEDNTELEWNIGLMGRLDIEYKRILNTDPLVNINWTSLIGGFDNYNVREVIATDDIMYYRFILNDIITFPGSLNDFPNYGSIEYYTYDKANIASNTQTVETIYWDRNGFDYVYGNSVATFVDVPSSPFQGFVKDYNQDLYAYKVKKDGKYYIEVTFSDINETFGKFYHLFVTNKKGISFLGNEGEYLINQSTLGSAQVYDSSVILSSRQSGVNTVTLSGTFDLLAGDIIELIIAIEGGLFGLFDLEFSSIRFKVYPQFDVELDIAKLLPDINSIDFISSLQRTFNLFIVTDLNDNTVSINSYSTNFLPVSSAINIDNKCNIRDAVFTPVTNNALIDTIIQADESDILSSEKRANNQSTVTQGIYTVQNYFDSFYRNNNSYFTEVQEIVSFFSDTIGGLFKWIYNNGTPDDTTAGFLELPLLANSDALSYTLQELSDGTAVNNLSYNLRLLKYMGLRPLKNTSGVYALMVDNHGYYDLAGNNSALMDTATYIAISGANTRPIIPIAVYEPYILTTYDIPNAELIDDSNVLTYADKYIYTSNPTNLTILQGLYNGYFIQFIKDTNNSIQVDVPVWLDISDIEDIDPKKYIVFYNQLFFLKEIKDFDPINRKLTTITLIRK